MAWDVDLVLVLVDPHTGRFRGRRVMLRSLVAAVTIAEAVHTGQLVLAGDRVSAAPALVRPPEQGGDELGDPTPRTDVTAGEGQSASAPTQDRPQAGRHDPVVTAPPDSATAGAGEGAGLAATLARQLEWPEAPVRASRLIRRVGKVALKETLDCARSESALRESPRQRSRPARFLVADPVRRELLLEQVAKVGPEGDAEDARAHTLLALLVAAGRLDVIAPHADRHVRARARQVAVGSWAAQAYRRSLGLDPLRVSRRRARRGDGRPDRQSVLE